MNRKQLEQMEKYWEKYHRAIPDFPIENKKQWNVDQSLTVVMAFLIGILFVLIMLLIYTIEVAS